MKPRPKYDPFEPGWTPPKEAFEFFLSDEFHEFHDGPKQYVLDGLLALGEFSVVFGDPASGKGNFVTTLACAVGGAQTFFGRQAGWLKDGEWLPGGVLYFALERHKQVQRRVKAYEQEHGAPHHIPVAVCSAQFDIRDDDAASQIVETLYDAHAQTYMRLEDGPGVCNFKPDYNLIIIDTLSMALQGGSDSDPGDMGKAIHTIKKVIAETDAHVMLIHHSPVSGDGRMRGYGTLNAAIDLSIRVEDRKTHRLASIVKNSDGPDGAKFYYTLKSADVPHWQGDQYGEAVGDPFMVSVPLLVEMDEPPAKERAAVKPKEPKRPKPSKSEQPVLAALAGLTTATESEWRAAYDAAPEEGVSPANHRTRFSRGKTALVEKGLVTVDGDNFSVTEFAVTEKL